MLNVLLQILWILIFPIIGHFLIYFSTFLSIYFIDIPISIRWRGFSFSEGFKIHILFIFYLKLFDIMFPMML